MRIKARLGLLGVSVLCASTCADGVTPSAVAVVADVVAAADSVLIPAVGFERTLDATALGEDGQPVAGASLVWGSRSPHIVQVSSSGVARARALGEALVIVSVGSSADTVVVKVVQVPATFVLDGPDTIWSAAGRETVTLTKIDSAGVPIPDPPDWLSSDPAVAEGFNSGGNFPRVATHAVGQARITAVLRGVSSNSIDVVVRQRPARLFLGYTRNFLNVGDTMTISADVEDATSVDIPGAPVAWSTSDSTVARITQNGFVTAVGGGYVIFSGRSGNVVTSGTMPVYLSSPPPGVLRVSPTAYHSDSFGERISLRALVDDGVSPPTTVPAAWASRNTNVATITPYFATTQGNGSTWLVATYDGRADSIALEVQRVPIALSFQDLPRQFAITYSSGAPVYPLTLDRVGGFYQNSSETLWTIRDPSIVEVTTGGIEARRKGSTWVVAELEGVSDSVHVTVIPRLDQDFAIATQADLEYFADREVDEVRGTLRIHGTSLSSLDGLETLRTVGGELRISSNAALSDMGGLRNLETVAGPIVIEDNPALTVGLPHLREAGSLDVFRNLALESHSFGALRRVSAELDLGVPGPAIYFDSLVSTGSMMWQGRSPSSVHYPVLETIGNDLTFLDTQDLVTFSAPLLWRARSVHVLDNARLTTLNVPSLSTLVRDLTISENSALATLGAFSALSSGVRRLEIEDNTALTNIDGLRQIGDALGSDPILFESCIVRRNPLLAGTQVVLDFLENKFLGEGVNCLFN